MRLDDAMRLAGFEWNDEMEGYVKVEHNPLDKTLDVTALRLLGLEAKLSSVDVVNDPDVLTAKLASMKKRLDAT